MPDEDRRVEAASKWEHHVVWQKGNRYYIANLADGENGIGPFDCEDDAEAALAGLRADLLDRLEGERGPVAWLVECQVGGREWVPGSFRVEKTYARERVKRFNEHERVQARLVPLYRPRTDQGENR